VKRFVALLMLAGGLLAASGQSVAASLGTVTYYLGPSFTPNTLSGNVGDTFIVDNQRFNGINITVPAELRHVLYILSRREL
jgi:hypothetical protein